MHPSKTSSLEKKVRLKKRKIAHSIANAFKVTGCHLADEISELIE